MTDRLEGRPLGSGGGGEGGGMGVVVVMVVDLCVLVLGWWLSSIGVFVNIYSHRFETL